MPSHITTEYPPYLFPISTQSPLKENPGTDGVGVLKRISPTKKHSRRLSRSPPSATKHTGGSPSTPTTNTLYHRSPSGTRRRSPSTSLTPISANRAAARGLPRSQSQSHKKGRALQDSDAQVKQAGKSPLVHALRARVTKKLFRRGSKSARKHTPGRSIINRPRFR